MSHRTQITLEDAQYERLRAESRQSGLGLAELVRRAIDQVYNNPGADEFLRALDDSFGAWKDNGEAEAAVQGLRSARDDRFQQW